MKLQVSEPSQQRACGGPDAGTKRQPTPSSPPQRPSPVPEQRTRAAPGHSALAVHEVPALAAGSAAFELSSGTGGEVGPDFAQASESAKTPRITRSCTARPCHGSPATGNRAHDPGAGVTSPSGRARPIAGSAEASSSYASGLACLSAPPGASAVPMSSRIPRTDP